MEVGYFGEQITLKVKVAKIELNKVKVGQKLAKSPQLSITLKVGLTFFCLCFRELRDEVEVYIDDIGAFSDDWKSHMVT